MLRQSAGALLAAGLWPGVLAAEGKAGGEDFPFLVVNDLHFKDAAKCGAWFARVIKQMKAHEEKPELLLIVGDLAQDGKPTELTPIRDQFKTLGVPFHVVIGNHDYQPKDDRKPYEEIFPKSLNYTFDHKGWQLIGLDSSDGVRYNKTSIQKPTLQWLDDNLPKLDKKKPTIVFTHFPLGPKVTNAPLNAEDVLNRFKEFNLRAVFNGHYHGFTEKTVGETVLTTNRCCAQSVGNHDGTKEKGYFLCQAKDGKITRKSIEVKPA